MTTQSDRPPRNLPRSLIIILILLALAGAAWILWLSLSSANAPKHGVFTIQGAEPGNLPRQAATRFPATSAIREISPTQWRIRARPFALTITKDPAGQLSPILLVSGMQYLPADATWVLAAKTHLDSAAIARIGLTPSQVAQFKSLPTSLLNRVPLNDTQINSLRTAFQAYLLAAPPQRDPAEKQLLTLLNQIGQQSLTTLPPQLKSQYAAFEKSLTPQQWQQLKSLAAQPPATLPATPQTP